MAGSAHEPNTPELGILGELLRAARNAAGATTRQVPGFSSGHVSNAENGRVMPSRQFVLLYVNRFGCDRARVLSAYARAKAAGEARRRGGGPRDVEPVEEVTAESPREEIASTYWIHEKESLYCIDDRGVIAEVHTVEMISAMAPNVSLFTRRFAYPTDPRRGVIRVEAGHGCAVERLQESGIGVVVAVFRLDHDIHPGEDGYRLGYSLRVDSAAEAVPRVSFGSTTGVGRVGFRLLYPRCRVPRTVHWFRGRKSVVEFSEPDHRNEIIGSGGVFYSHDFMDVRDDVCGLQWAYG
ncbi:helix-turn-helix domain-containing protein [Nocardiopsis chromatogenes]|uniref:helix-turn-helix domain-containing protein n=1 Tax=Nocardiopsis chromatogenes TaxID=280239 RepID=UPI0003747976|nr:helix-turn-helix transcriptional regulator [Nocardiopsis chromatogenes]